MGEWVLHQSCVECKRWHDAGFTDFTIAVNLSVVQFRRSNIPELVTQALERTGLPASALELELTESLLVDDAAINLQLQELRAMGVSIAIDDFGTGYSNLGYLNKFSIGTLKIDQSFIRNIVQQPEDLAIVRAIIQIASSLSMKTVAEGVEDLSTLNLLQELHCDLFQGYLRAPALSASAFLDYIKRQQPA
jgi:EAL domain-containing protein (putative c-di-GMP-specific phosphodiesterase class I)